MDSEIDLSTTTTIQSRKKSLQFTNILVRQNRRNRNMIARRTDIITAPTVSLLLLGILRRLDFDFIFERSTKSILIRLYVVRQEMLQQNQLKSFTRYF